MKAKGYKVILKAQGSIFVATKGRMEILVSSRFNTLWSKEEFHLTSKASMQLWYKLGLEGSLGMQHRILGYLWPIREYLDNNQAC